MWYPTYGPKMRTKQEKIDNNSILLPPQVIYIDWIAFWGASKYNIFASIGGSFHFRFFFLYFIILCVLFRRSFIDFIDIVLKVYTQHIHSQIRNKMENLFSTSLNYCEQYNWRGQRNEWRVNKIKTLIRTNTKHTNTCSVNFFQKWNTEASNEKEREKIYTRRHTIQSIIVLLISIFMCIHRHNMDFIGLFFFVVANIDEFTHNDTTWISHVKCQYCYLFFSLSLYHISLVWFWFYFVSSIS